MDITLKKTNLLIRFIRHYGTKLHERSTTNGCELLSALGLALFNFALYAVLAYWKWALYALVALGYALLFVLTSGTSAAHSLRSWPNWVVVPAAGAAFGWTLLMVGRLAEKAADRLVQLSLKCRLGRVANSTARSEARAERERRWEQRWDKSVQMVQAIWGALTRKMCVRVTLAD